MLLHLISKEVIYVPNLILKKSYEVLVIRSHFHVKSCKIIDDFLINSKMYMTLISDRKNHKLFWYEVKEIIYYK